ncbi:hypothetical protein FKM82_030896 [Ascaphus truei]
MMQTMPAPAGAAHTPLLSWCRMWLPAHAGSVPNRSMSRRCTPPSRGTGNRGVPRLRNPGEGRAEGGEGAVRSPGLLGAWRMLVLLLSVTSQAPMTSQGWE